MCLMCFVVCLCMWAIYRPVASHSRVRFPLQQVALLIALNLSTPAKLRRLFLSHCSVPCGFNSAVMARTGWLGTFCTFFVRKWHSLGLVMRKMCSAPKWAAVGSHGARWEPFLPFYGCELTNCCDCSTTIERWTTWPYVFVWPMDPSNSGICKDFQLSLYPV